jgi:hypothetical protein
MDIVGWPRRARSYLSAVDGLEDADGTDCIGCQPYVVVRGGRTTTHGHCHVCEVTRLQCWSDACDKAASYYHVRLPRRNMRQSSATSSSIEAKVTISELCRYRSFRFPTFSPTPALRACASLQLLTSASPPHSLPPHVATDQQA